MGQRRKFTATNMLRGMKSMPDEVPIEPFSGRENNYKGYSTEKDEHIE